MERYRSGGGHSAQRVYRFSLDNGRTKGEEAYEEVGEFTEGYSHVTRKSNICQMTPCKQKEVWGW